MLLLLDRQGAWPKQKAPSDAGGAWWKDVVVEFLARDSSYGPAEAGHVVEVDFARRFNHEGTNSTAIEQNQEMCDFRLQPGGEHLPPAHPFSARRTLLKCA
jgi:hypothetical protein